MKTFTSFSQLFLRITLGISFIAACLDRFGLVAPPGSPSVSWGDWNHFSIYAHKLMPFMPYALAEWLAILASVAELIFGILLIIGWFTRLTSIGSGLLLISFGISMTIALGIHAPLSYSVFTAGAAGFLLATVPAYSWSIDALIKNKKRDTTSPIVLMN